MNINFDFDDLITYHVRCDKSEWVTVYDDKWAKVYTQLNDISIWYDYDLDGNITTITEHSQSNIIENDFDINGNVTRTMIAFSKTNEIFEHFYDANGNEITKAVWRTNLLLPL